MEAPPIPDKVCTPCLENNLISPGVVETFQVCNQCKEEFCIHGVSKLDPQYCAACCSDFKVVDVEEIVTREVHNEQGEVTSSKNFRIRHLSLSGLHWLFHNRAIATLTDIELDHAIEYHRSIFNGMLNERDARFVTRIQRNKGKRAGNEERSLIEGTAAHPLIHTGEGAKLSITKTTRTRTVRTTQSGASAQSKEIHGVPTNVMKSMKALGYSEEQIIAMCKV